MDGSALLLLGLTGFIAGALGAMLGLGGGVLIVPLLSGPLGLPIHQAMGASLVGVVATSSAGATVYLKSRLANVRLGLTLQPLLAISAMIGGLIASLLSGRILAGLFTLLILYAAYSMLKPRPIETQPMGPGIDEHVQLAANSRGTERLSGVIFDSALGKKVAYRVRALPAGLGLGFVAGTMGGLLGVGGGLITVPVLHLVMGVPMKASVATSNYAMGITASAAALVYLSRGSIDPFTAAPVALGVVLGAQVGSRVSQRIQTAALKQVFVVVLLLMAVQMALKALDVRF